VEVSALLERFQHRLAVGHMCQNSKLQLSVVRNYQQIALFWNEGFPDFVLIFVQRRLVLQVWSTRREPASFRVYVETAVDSGVLVCQILQWADECLDQGFDVSVFKQ
jgi:hypothetical protein